MGNYTKYINLLTNIFNKQNTGLPHTQGIQRNSEDFKVEENLRETQGIFELFFKLREVFILLKNSRKF